MFILFFYPVANLYNYNSFNNGTKTTDLSSLVFMDFISDFLSNYGLGGLFIGFSTFLIIGLFHPLVIKGEYYFGEKIKWAFLIAGIVFLVLSVMVKGIVLSALFGVTSFSSFWGIKEVVEQVERVRKGWFPANPKHPERYKSIDNKKDGKDAVSSNL